MKSMQHPRYDQKCRPGNKTQLNQLSKLRCRIFSLRLNCYESLWLYKDKGRLQGIPQNFDCNYPKDSLSWELLLASVYVKNCQKPQPEEQTPCHSSFPGGDHLQSTLGIICGSIWGSFEVWGSFAVGDHLRRCTTLYIPGSAICLKFMLEYLTYLQQANSVLSKLYSFPGLRE